MKMFFSNKPSLAFARFQFLRLTHCYGFPLVPAGPVYSMKCQPLREAMSTLAAMFIATSWSGWEKVTKAVGGSIVVIRLR